MESKKLNKKFSSTFWWIIYSFPLIVFLLILVGYISVYKQTGLTDFFAQGYITYVFDDVNVIFEGFSWSFIYDSFLSLFDSLGIVYGCPSSIFFIYLFSWFIMMNFLHILVDVLLLLPRMFHNFMERWS